MDVKQDQRKIRVENQPGISISRYDELVSGDGAEPPVRRFSILFLNPYQPIQSLTHCPPLGILTLIASLRKYFGEKVDIDFLDMRVHGISADRISEYLLSYSPDVVGVSAKNCEMSAAYELADQVKAWNSGIITVLGGPTTLRQASMHFRDSQFDWIFESSADRTFPMALERQFSGMTLGNDIPGFSYRSGDDPQVITYNTSQDVITDLDSIPIPAWDMVDFDAYHSPDKTRMTPNVANRRYATLFTSRGCPYLCNYCHDLFSKKFVYRSDENVLEEIDLLYSEYGITEFFIVDDIFNLHKPRVHSLMGKIQERWGDELYFAFPNGLRGDILDQKTIDALVSAGTYQAIIAIESVTPRLQDKMDKHLDIDQAFWAINEMGKQGVVIGGSFMLGFPTETVDEIKATIRSAIRSRLTTAYFFPVMPQPGTPIHDIAMEENREATLLTNEDEKTRGHYNIGLTWYQRAYGYPLRARIALTYFLFYLYPPRFLRIVRVFPVRAIVKASWFVLHQTFVNGTWALYENMKSVFKMQKRPALSRSDD